MLKIVRGPILFQNFNFFHDFFHESKPESLSLFQKKCVYETYTAHIKV